MWHPHLRSAITLPVSTAVSTIKIEQSAVNVETDSPESRFGKDEAGDAECMKGAMDDEVAREPDREEAAVILWPCRGTFS